MYDVYLSMRHTPLSMYYSGWLEKYLGSSRIRIHHGFNQVREGLFPNSLVKQIQVIRNFIVILTPETFGFDDDNTSWMAREIETALKNGTNIIPIMTSDFVWPDSLPSKIADIRNIAGITIENHNSYGNRPKNFDDVVDAIRRRLVCNPKKESVFISYNTKDWRIASQIRDMLEQHDISCWMAPDSIPAGENYASIIPNAIVNCDIFLLILSKHSQESNWVPKELDTAINNNRVVIPFQIDEANLTNTFSFYLANCQRILAASRLDDARWELKDRIYNILSRTK